MLEKRLFEAWGNVLVKDGAGNTLDGLSLLDRGYTGHEHLQSVGLIHMNGRLYDAKLHRFLQQDNYVQDPADTQNYNRYGYVLNNPLKYTDPSGELSFKSVFKIIKNAFRIEMGLFQVDKNRTFGGQVLQILGRFTWESAQTDLGKLYTQVNNITGNVDRVDYFGGATFATNENSKKRNGITFGNYININTKDKIEGSFENRVLTDQLYMHEYGHTLDSQYWGGFYLPAIGLPSGISSWQSIKRENDPAHDHY